MAGEAKETTTTAIDIPNTRFFLEALKKGSLHFDRAHWLFPPLPSVALAIQPLFAARRFAQYFFIRAETAARFAAVHVTRRRLTRFGAEDGDDDALVAPPFRITFSAARSRLISNSLAAAPSFVKWLSWSRDNSEGTLCSPC